MGYSKPNGGYWPSKGLSSSTPAGPVKPSSSMPGKPGWPKPSKPAYGGGDDGEWDDEEDCDEEEGDWPKSSSTPASPNAPKTSSKPSWGKPSGGAGWPKPSKPAHGGDNGEWDDEEDCEAKTYDTTTVETITKTITKSEGGHSWPEPT